MTRWSSHVRRVLPYVCLASAIGVSAQALAAGKDGGNAVVGPALSAEMRAQADAARAAWEAAQQRRKTPEARAERARSRTAYRGLGREDALALAKTKLGDVFEQKAFEPWRLPPGLHVKRYAGETGAVLEGEGDTEPLFVESMGAPLTSELGSGEPEPVDLTLEPEGPDAFKLRNPNVPTRIGRDGSASFADSGTSIRLAGSTAEAPIETNGRLFYANALRDTDMALAPLPGGVSFSFSVRSADAPEQAALDFDLPAGVRMRPGASVPELVELVRGTEVVGRVNPPKAWDADGEPVAVGYEIDGDRLLVNYPHQQKDLAYPIYVDPDYEDWGWGAGDWAGWGFEESGSTAFTGGLVSGYLRVWSTANVSFPSGSFGAYRFANPRGYIRRLDGGNIYHWHWATCMSFGMLVPDRTTWKARYAPACNTNTSNASPVVNNTDNRYGDHAMLQLWMNGTGWRQYQATVQMYYTRATYGDNEDPTVTNVANSTNGAWKKAGDSVTITPTGYDQGMGLYAFTLYPDAGAQSWTAGCNGTHQGGRCPTGSVSGPMTYTIPSNSQEGVQTVSGEAMDLLGKRRQFSTPVKVDRTKPTVELGGMLYHARNTTIRGAQHDLDVTATDQTGLSGVNHVEIKVDGVLRCSNCSATTTDWTYNGVPSSGTVTRTIEVTAVDNAGNRSDPTTFQVNWSSKPCDGTPL